MKDMVKFHPGLVDLELELMLEDSNVITVAALLLAGFLEDSRRPNHQIMHWAVKHQCTAIIDYCQNATSYDIREHEGKYSNKRRPDGSYFTWAELDAHEAGAEDPLS